MGKTNPEETMEDNEATENTPKADFSLANTLHDRFPDHIAEFEYQRTTLPSAPISTGKGHLLRYLSGERLTQRQAILAKCCDCCGHYVDGRYDCDVPLCPLYPIMPYQGKMRPK